MNEELLLSMINAEYYNEQRRLSINTSARQQTKRNLVDGLSPYVISKVNSCLRDEISNEELFRSSETMQTCCDDYDIDFDLILPEDCLDETEFENADVELDDSNDNLVFLNEICSFKDKNNSIPLHPYTSISTGEFCIAILRILRQANLCKSYSSKILELIHLALPQPNNLPISINAINKYLQGKFLFFNIQKPWLSPFCALECIFEKPYVKMIRKKI